MSVDKRIENQKAEEFVLKLQKIEVINNILSESDEFNKEELSTLNQEGLEKILAEIQKEGI